MRFTVTKLKSIFFVISGTHTIYSYFPHTITKKKNLFVEKYIELIKLQYLIHFIANSILEYMNQNVRPCDDFYQFVCGKFIETNSIPDEISELNQFILIEKELNMVLLGDIKSNISSTEIKAIQNAKNYYRNCMDERKKIYNLHTFIIKSVINKISLNIMIFL